MLKLFFAALILTSASTSRLAHAYAPCATGQMEMSVEGVEGIFCVQGNSICIADVSNGTCPGVQPGLRYGSYCGIVATNVYGCKVLAAPTVSTASTSVTPSITPASTTPAPTSTSATPAPVETPRLPHGSSCGIVTSGVHGCKVSPSTTSATSTPSSPAPSTGAASESSMLASSGINSSSNCPSGESDMSVEGVKGFFCVAGGPLCSASLSDGLCPGKSDRLPVGSYCGIVASGVYGCKILNADLLETLSPVVATPTTTAPAGSPVIPVPSAPAASYKASTATPPLPTTAAPADSTATSSDCPNGGTSMSVVGISKVFCVPGVACAGEKSNGACPVAEPALPNGAYCGIVRPGVYGCKPIV